MLACLNIAKTQPQCFIICRTFVCPYRSMMTTPRHVYIPSSRQTPSSQDAPEKQDRSITGVDSAVARDAPRCLSSSGGSTSRAGDATPRTASGSASRSRESKIKSPTKTSRSQSASDSNSPRKIPHFALPTQASLVAASFSPADSPRRSSIRTPCSGAAADELNDPKNNAGKVVPGHVAGKSSARNRSHDLQEAHDTIAKMREELRLMRSDLKRKEAALLETTREVDELKKKNMLLNTALSSHRHEVRELRAKKSALESLSLQSPSMEEMVREKARAGGSERRINKMHKLEQENAFLLAAINRYDSAVVSLKEVISVMVTHKMKGVDHDALDRTMDGPVQDKLREVLESLLRVKDEQVCLPYEPRDSRHK